MCVLGRMSIPHEYIQLLIMVICSGGGMGGDSFV